MRIYIENYNPKKFPHQRLEPYLIKKSEVGDIYSDEGIYQITKSQLLQFTIEDREPQFIKLSNHNLIIDNSIIRKKCVNYLPTNHIFIKTREFYYKYKTSPLIFIVRYIENECFSFTPSSSQFEAVDCYFELHDNSISNDILKEMINEFLLLLN